MWKSVLTMLAVGFAASPANAVVIETGSYGSGSFFETASASLGPGRYRFTLAFSTPLESFSGSAQKLTITSFFCDDDDGSGEFACGGDDVPTIADFEAVTPLLYQSNLTVNAPDPGPPPGPPPYVRFEDFDDCCTFEFGGESLTSGSYTLSYTLVPEPEAWALMIAGFGLAGAALRGRKVASPRCQAG